jgi:hypothetical protein
LSQAFEQTQAPTSALRQLTPNSLDISGPNSSRPSPDIELKLRPNLSQALGTSQQQSVRRTLFTDINLNEVDHDIGRYELGDSSGETDETSVDDAGGSGGNTRWAGGKHAAALKDSEPGHSDRQEEQISARSMYKRAAMDGENGAAVNRSTETSESDDTSDDDNGSEEESYSGEEASKSEYEFAVTEGGGEEDENEDSNDSMVKETRNDWLANIKESARLSQQQASTTSRKITRGNDDETSSDSSSPGSSSSSE